MGIVGQQHRLRVAIEWMVKTLNRPNNPLRADVGWQVSIWSLLGEATGTWLRNRTGRGTGQVHGGPLRRAYPVKDDRRGVRALDARSSIALALVVDYRRQ